jgi:predicted secreted protein
MRLPQLRLPTEALARPLASALAAVVLATSSPSPLLAAQPALPSNQELTRLSFGLARIDYLLDNCAHRRLGSHCSSPLAI